MKLKHLSAILLACAIVAPAVAGQAPKSGHTMPTKMSSTKGKMRNLGHGVYSDSKGRYHSKDGKFMSKAAGDKALGRGGKSMSKRDSHGRFTSSKSAMRAKKPGMMTRIKAKMHMKAKPKPNKQKPKS